MLHIAFGWVSLIPVFILIVIFCYGIVKYYSDRHESERLPTVVTVVALTLTLLALFLIPVDILSVSTAKDAAGNFVLTAGQIASRGATVRNLYYVLYGLIMGAAFIFIPFAYFYFEEFDEDVTVRQRVVAGLKYTSFLIVILIVLFIVGIFVKPGTPTDASYQDYIKYVLDTQDGGERSIGFVVACLTVLGYIAWISYTAYGLSAFPIGLLKGKRHIVEEASDLISDIDSTRERQREITSKYLTGKRMSQRDQSQVDLLKRQEKMLARQKERLDQQQRGFARVVAVCKPFAFLFGIFFFLISFFLIICFLLGLIDKISSSCGTACGFVASHPQLTYPINVTLAALEPYFPLDYVFLGSIIVFIFFCTLHGIIRIGIRFLWVHLFSIRARRTAPQGLLLATLMLMLALLALNMQIMTLAPKYTMYGSQVYANNSTGALEPCTINSPEGECAMSQIGTIVTRIQIGTPFFGVVYYVLTWVFIATFLIGFVVAIVKRKDSNVVAEDDEDDDENGTAFR